METKWIIRDEVSSLFTQVFGIEFKDRLCFGSSAYTKAELLDLRNHLRNLI